MRIIIQWQAVQACLPMRLVLELYSRRTNSIYMGRSVVACCSAVQADEGKVPETSRGSCGFGSSRR